MTMVRSDNQTAQVSLGSANTNAQGILQPNLMAASAGRARIPFVRLMRHVPCDAALAAQREAGLLLLLENPAPESRAVLTGKLFEYIGAGRPILCLGSHPGYEIGQVFAATRTDMVLSPQQYGDIGSVIARTLDGEGLYADFRPVIDETKKYSRARQSH